VSISEQLPGRQKRRSLILLDWLWNELGYHLSVVADYKGAKEHYERALEIDEKVLGPDHPNVAMHIGNLGRVLRDQGDLDEARENFERTLCISKNFLMRAKLT
jgi:tetratricopeptide (TPR) repeat protein